MKGREFTKGKLQIAYIDKRQGRWKFANRDVSGTVYEYEVIDDNFNSWKHWAFLVRVPKRVFGTNYIEVRPKDHPELRCWAGIEQKSIQFRRSTLGDYRSCAYTKVKFAQVSDPRKSTRLTRGERDLLPSWMESWDLRLKNTVITTRGTDGNDQVAVVGVDDYEEMIRLFFALKAWPLRLGYEVLE